MDANDSQKQSANELAPRPGFPTVLPSGRKLVLQVEKGAEVLELHSPTGEVEFSIEFSENGPMVRVRGANLVLDSPGSVSVNCRDLSIRATEGIHLEAGAELSLRSQDDIRVKSAKQAFIDGDYVNLNCLERTGYHDEGVQYEVEEPGSPGELESSVSDAAAEGSATGP